MLGDTIKKLRKEKNISQEELALQLYVVRQTISKWETGKSVPDTDELIRLSECLGVSVTELLGMESERCEENYPDAENEKYKKEKLTYRELAEQLAELNEELASRKERELLLRNANEVRGFILLLSFTGIICRLVLKNEALALGGMTLCFVGALVILYRNLVLLTQITTEDLKLKPLKIVTGFNIMLILFCAVLAGLVQVDIIRLSENGEKFTAALIVSVIIFFTGYMAPRLPFTRHTGLRLPWTVSDQDTWNVAHQILGMTAVPVGIIYLGLISFVDNFELLTGVVVLVWIGIPSLISFIYFYRKFHGK